MEYTDYFVVKGDAGAARKKVARVSKRAVLVDGQAGFVPFVALGKTDKFPGNWDWLLSVFDAEGSAWGFRLYVDGEEVASAKYGENEEWGIDEDDNGLEGDLDETAAALGTTASKLKKCLNESGAEKFCKLVGFTHQYMLYPHEGEMPKGVKLLSEMG